MDKYEFSEDAFTDKKVAYNMFMEKNCKLLKLMYPFLSTSQIKTRANEKWKVEMGGNFSSTKSSKKKSVKKTGASKRRRSKFGPLDVTLTPSSTGSSILKRKSTPYNRSRRVTFNSEEEILYRTPSTDNPVSPEMHTKNWCNDIESTTLYSSEKKKPAEPSTDNCTWSYKTEKFISICTVTQSTDPTSIKAVIHEEKNLMKDDTSFEDSSDLPISPTPQNSAFATQQEMLNSCGNKMNSSEFLNTKEDEIPISSPNDPFLGKVTFLDKGAVKDTTRKAGSKKNIKPKNNRKNSKGRKNQFSNRVSTKLTPRPSRKLRTNTKKMSEKDSFKSDSDSDDSRPVLLTRKSVSSDIPNIESESSECDDGQIQFHVSDSEPDGDKFSEGRKKDGILLSSKLCDEMGSTIVKDNNDLLVINNTFDSLLDSDSSWENKILQQKCSQEGKLKSNEMEMDCLENEAQAQKTSQEIVSSKVTGKALKNTNKAIKSKHQPHNDVAYEPPSSPSYDFLSQIKNSFENEGKELSPVEKPKKNTKRAPHKKSTVKVSKPTVINNDLLISDNESEYLFQEKKNTPKQRNRQRKPSKRRRTTAKKRSAAVIYFPDNDVPAQKKMLKEKDKTHNDEAVLNENNFANVTLNNDEEHSFSLDTSPWVKQARNSKKGGLALPYTELINTEAKHNVQTQISVVEELNKQNQDEGTYRKFKIDSSNSNKCNEVSSKTRSNKTTNSNNYFSSKDKSVNKDAANFRVDSMLDTSRNHTAMAHEISSICSSHSSLVVNLDNTPELNFSTNEECFSETSSLKHVAPNNLKWDIRTHRVCQSATNFPPRKTKSIPSFHANKLSSGCPSLVPYNSKDTSSLVEKILSEMRKCTEVFCPLQESPRIKAVMTDFENRELPDTDLTVQKGYSIMKSESTSHGRKETKTLIQLHTEKEGKIVHHFSAESTVMGLSSESPSDSTSSVSSNRVLRSKKAVDEVFTPVKIGIRAKAKADNSVVLHKKLYESGKPVDYYAKMMDNLIHKSNQTIKAVPPTKKNTQNKSTKKNEDTLYSNCHSVIEDKWEQLMSFVSPKQDSTMDEMGVLSECSAHISPEMSSSNDHMIISDTEITYDSDKTNNIEQKTELNRSSEHLPITQTMTNGRTRKHKQINKGLFMDQNNDVKKRGSNRMACPNRKTVNERAEMYNVSLLNESVFKESCSSEDSSNFSISDISDLFDNTCNKDAMSKLSAGRRPFARVPSSKPSDGKESAKREKQTIKHDSDLIDAVVDESLSGQKFDEVSTNKKESLPETMICNFLNKLTDQTPLVETNAVASSKKKRSRNMSLSKIEGNDCLETNLFPKMASRCVKKTNGAFCNIEDVKTPPTSPPCPRKPLSPFSAMCQPFAHIRRKYLADEEDGTFSLSSSDEENKEIQTPKVKTPQFGGGILCDLFRIPSTADLKRGNWLKPLSN